MEGWLPLFLHKIKWKALWFYVQIKFSNLYKILKIISRDLRNMSPATGPQADERRIVLLQFSDWTIRVTYEDTMPTGGCYENLVIKGS